MKSLQVSLTDILSELDIVIISEFTTCSVTISNTIINNNIYLRYKCINNLMYLKFKCQ